METLQFTWSGAADERLDKVLAELVPSLSRSRIQALIKEAKAGINGVPCEKARTLIQPGDTLWLEVPEAQPTELVPEAIPLDILYEDSNVIVINKPAGMVVHPSAGHDSGTLVHAVLAHCKDLQGIGGELRPGIVHRLDKDTSGIILVAKNEKSLTWLQDQFKRRDVQKTYYALVDGAPPTPTGRVDAEIARDPSKRKKMAVVTPGRGRAAVTEYETVQRFASHTLVKAHPLTGRTHQIRLHLAFLGTPIVGDKIYGKRKSTLALERHFLHAGELEIILPGEKEPVKFSAPLPADLQVVLDNLN